MKYVVLVAALLLTGCISSSEYTKLEKENAQLKMELENLKKTAQYGYQYGVEKMNAGEYQEAIKSFNDVILKYPSDPYAEQSKKRINEIGDVSLSHYQNIEKEVKGLEKPADKIAYIESALIQRKISPKDSGAARPWKGGETEYVTIKENYLNEEHLGKLKSEIAVYQKMLPPVEVADTKIVREYEDYNNRVKFFVQFKNNSPDKEIVGVGFAFEFKNSFNKVLYKNYNEWDVKIAPGNKNNMGTYMYWDDNQFINDEVYDRLAVPVSEGTLKVKVEVKKVVYSDGTSWGK